MKCQLYQWRVSSALDKQKNIPEYIKRHMESCAGCKNFVRTAGFLGAAAKNDAAELIGIRREYAPALDLSPPGVPAHRLRKRILLPVYAGALAAMVLALVLLRPVILPQKNSLPQQLSSLKGVFAPGGSVREFTAKVGSPVERELQSLRTLLQTTRDTLLSSFDLGITSE